jgi:hypothetical protein
MAMGRSRRPIHPGLLAVPVRLKVLGARLAVVVMPVQAFHRHFHGGFAQAAPANSDALVPREQTRSADGNSVFSENLM